MNDCNVVVGLALFLGTVVGGGIALTVLGHVIKNEIKNQNKEK